jgi:hypothetical protein
MVVCHNFLVRCPRQVAACGELPGSPRGPFSSPSLYQLISSRQQSVRSRPPGRRKHSRTNNDAMCSPRTPFSRLVSWHGLCDYRHRCGLVTCTFMVRAATRNGRRSTSLDGLGWGDPVQKPGRLSRAKSRPHGSRIASSTEAARQPARKPKERSQRRLRPGKAVTSPTTSHATTLPVPGMGTRQDEATRGHAPFREIRTACR